jgi:predicted histone-like DNA-binding protein
MPLKFKVFKNNRPGKKHGYYYGKAIVTGVSNTQEIAKSISSMCTVTYPDIVAVLAALPIAMAHEMQEGNRVDLANFGSFKLGISTNAVKDIKEFSTSQINSFHVLFRPESTLNNNTRKRENTFTKGCKAERMKI